MTPESPPFADLSYKVWIAKTHSNAHDEIARPYLHDTFVSYLASRGREPVGGHSQMSGHAEQLFRSRQALKLSTSAVARRMGVARATYVRFEAGERKGSIKLATLQAAAEAMDCELIYGIRPKSLEPFSKILWRKLEPKLKRRHHNRYVKFEYMIPLRNAVFDAHEAEKLVRNPRLRRELGWSERS